DIWVRESNGSGRQCVLRCGARSAWLRDLVGRNGTRIGRELLRLESRLIVPDDVIHIAQNAVRLGAVVPVNPVWLAWNEGCVVRMARRIDEEQDYATLPVLADALEDAGCDDADILTHCRAGQVHSA